MDSTKGWIGFICLAIIAISLPIASNLVQKNQDNRSQARSSSKCASLKGKCRIVSSRLKEGSKCEINGWAGYIKYNLCPGNSANRCCLPFKDKGCERLGGKCQYVPKGAKTGDLCNVNEKKGTILSNKCGGDLTVKCCIPNKRKETPTPSPTPIPYEKNTKIKSIKLNKNLMNLTSVKSEIVLSAIIDPAVDSRNITWRTANSNFAIVSNSGLVSTKKRGVAKITAIVGGKSDSCLIGIGLLKKPAIRNSKAIVNTSKTYSAGSSLFLNRFLEKRIYDVGLKTRAGVVEAARFLSLEFKDGIYYSSNTEGRFDHIGLNIKNSNICWGCKGNKFKYLGLNCSGFVNWVLLNGGFNLSVDNFNKVVKLPNVTMGMKKYIASYYLGNLITGSSIIPYNRNVNWNKVKVGDLVWKGSHSNYSGHIGIIIGIKGNNIYIANSASGSRYNGNGLIVETERKRRTSKRGYTQIVLMDGAYKKQGKLSNMW